MPDERTDREEWVPPDIAEDLRLLYAELERLSAIAQTLYVGIAMIVEALKNLEAMPHASDETKMHLRLALAEVKMHLRLALAEAKSALRLAHPVLEGE